MSKPAFTPGLWRIVEREQYGDGSVYPRHIVGGLRELQICQLESSHCASLALAQPDSVYASDTMIEAPGDVRSAVANAHLITAAPDMYFALAGAEAFIERLTPGGETLGLISAALRKARGAQ